MLCAGALLGACGDPLDSFGRFADVAVAEDEEAARMRAEAGDPGQDGGAGRSPLGGLLGLLGRGREGADSPPKSSEGDFLAFGEVGVDCGIRRSRMGEAMGEAAGFTVHDTIPGSTEARTHYVTGFDDGCARQFTAALVVLGDARTHETVRYTSGADHLAPGRTDAAYEALKARVCRVAHGQPCGAAMGRLGRRTLFVTAYRDFAEPRLWSELLLHDGTLVAHGLKGR